MKKRVTYLTTGLFLASAGLASAQSFTGEKAREIIPEANMIYKAERTNIPAFVELNSKAQADNAFSSPADAIRKVLDLDESVELKQTEVIDFHGITQFNYQQYYKGIPVEGAVYKARKKNGVLLSINGELYNVKNVTTKAGLSENKALDKALDTYGAKKYMWENKQVESDMKAAFEDPSWTYYPKGNLVYFPENGEYKANAKFKLAYTFDVYADEPFSAHKIYVDAETGETIAKYSLIHHADEKVQAKTRYSGTVEITVDNNGGNYCLKETGRGNGIVTYNGNNRQQPSGNTEFCARAASPLDLTNSRKDEVACDAHFAAEKTYDYLYETHGRNSIDNRGHRLVSYVHIGQNYLNAFWSNGVMSYGDGNATSNNNPLTSVDIGGHEIGHGLTENTANLVYSYESGALNESFSDIWGNVIQRYADLNGWTHDDWQMGEDLGWVIRSMSRPNDHNQPDTYKGTMWHTASSDNGGVHVNSGVQNYIFYLMVEGGQGTNDNRDAFDVTSIGWEASEKIAYGALLKLSRNSQYSDSREAWVSTAKELYGECSQEHISTQMAWYAGGIGQEPDCKIPLPVASFTADKQMICGGQTVQFTDESTGSPTAWEWTFEGGDPATSTEQNPQVVYTRPGTYKVTLVVTNDGGSDDHTEEAYITVTEPAELPFKEGFEDSFPIEGWTIENPDSAITWEKSTKAGAGSDACVIIDNANYDKVGQQDGLLLKEVDLSSGSKDPNLTFFVAYTRYDEDSEDKLSVLISTDCGETWESIYSKTKEELETKNVDFDESQEWVPEEYADWRFEALNLSDYKDEKSVKIKFESTNGYGNIIWLDNINIDYTVGTNDKTVAEHDVVVAPNPTSNSFELRFTAKEKDNYSIEVRNVLGEVVYVENLNNFSGLYNKSIDLASFSNGIYLLNIKDSNTNTVKKIIKK